MLRREREQAAAYLGTLGLIGLAGLAVVTAAGFAIGLGGASAGYAYMVLVVLLSLFDSFAVSALFSLLAIACLNYFFLEPRFSFQVLHSEDLVMLVAFLVTALVVTSLMGKARALGAANREQAELLALTAQLQQAQAELAHVTRVTTLGELTASVAHEVNQPLAAIVTCGEAGLRFLGRAPADLDEVKECLNRIIADGTRAGEVVQRIRGLARKADGQIAEIDLNALVQESVALLQREAAQHGAAVRLELAAAPPTVRGDRIQLQQVLVNLIINGLQAMAAVEGRARDLLIQTSLGPSGAGILVQDTGIGFAPDQAKRLFNAFFTTKPEGMGIGLSLCRTIVEAHGGRIWATANAGPGATFQLSLPVAAPRPD